MKDRPAPVSADQLSRLATAIGSLFPVPGLSGLRERLAFAWRTVTEANAACVVTRDAEHDSILAAWDSAETGTAQLECPFPTDAQFDRAALLEALGGWHALTNGKGVARRSTTPFVPQGVPPGRLIEDGSVECLTFGDAPIETGVLLFTSGTRGVSAGIECLLSSLSGGLVRQSILQQLSEAGAVRGGNLEARKLESLAEFAAGAGHEINNPLATIAGRIQLLLRTETDPEKRRTLETIGGQAYRIRDMIGDVMLFARPPSPKPQSLDLSEAVRTVAEKFRAGAQHRGCRIEVDAPAPVVVWADSGQLRIVIEILIRNSLEAIVDGETVRVSCRTIGEADRVLAELTVTDRGCGLTPLDREHLFDPFYSGRQAGRGLGFGLSKCWRIVSNHGGRIEVESDPEAATTFRVLWPSEGAEADALILQR